MIVGKLQKLDLISDLLPSNKMLAQWVVQDALQGRVVLDFGKVGQRDEGNYNPVSCRRHVLNQRFTLQAVQLLLLLGCRIRSPLEKFESDEYLIALTGHDLQLDLLTL